MKSSEYNNPYILSKIWISNRKWNPILQILQKRNENYVFIFAHRLIRYHLQNVLLLFTFSIAKNETLKKTYVLYNIDCIVYTKKYQKNIPIDSCFFFTTMSPQDTGSGL
jgi:hypothetical protein